MLITASVLLVLTLWLVSVVRNLRSRDRWAITEYNWDPHRRSGNTGWELTDAPPSSPENPRDEEAEPTDKQQR